MNERKYLETLRELHELLFNADDHMSQDDLFEAQAIVSGIIEDAEEEGSVELDKSKNGFINRITIVKSSRE
jgi:hypothetical protein